MQGARTTRTPGSFSPCRARSSSSAPASAQLRLSHTRTVTFGGRSSPVRHHVEMGVEGRDLVHLRHRDLELFRQRLQMSLRQTALLVLDEVQVFDQQRALARPVAE